MEVGDDAAGGVALVDEFRKPLHDGEVAVARDGGNEREVAVGQPFRDGRDAPS